MTAGVIALVAALATVAVVVAAGVVSRRARAASEFHITAALHELGSRMDLLSDELLRAIDSAHDVALRTSVLGAISGSLDLEETLARTADAVVSLPGIDAAVVQTTNADGGAAVAAAGISAGQAARQPISGPPDGTGARAIALSYVYPDGDDPPGALRASVAVPLDADGERLGFLAAYSHDPAPLSGDAVAQLEAIAAVAGPAIDTARQFREGNHTADLDAVTGLPGRRGFLDALTREIARSTRFEWRLTLLVLDLDDFAAVNTRLGQLGGDDVLRAVTRVVRSAVRDVDSAYRSGGDEIAILLPESTRIEAEALFARILATLQREHLGLAASGGIAQLQPGDDAIALYDRAEGALRRAKAIGKGTAA